MIYDQPNLIWIVILHIEMLFDVILPLSSNSRSVPMGSNLSNSKHEI